MFGISDELQWEINRLRWFLSQRVSDQGITLLEEYLSLDYKWIDTIIYNDHLSKNKVTDK